MTARGRITSIGWRRERFRRRVVMTCRSGFGRKRVTNMSKFVLARALLPLIRVAFEGSLPCDAFVSGSASTPASNPAVSIYVTVRAVTQQR